ncbi:hypothetical protein SEA_DATBOI_162 [Gordonia phage DatBoi]|nr:hypothetical protein SEA_DATBOI_162 [Gordonia phage DatBoi]
MSHRIVSDMSPRWSACGYRVTGSNDLITNLTRTTEVFAPSSYTAVLNMAYAWAGGEERLTLLHQAQGWSVHGMSDEGEILAYWVIREQGWVSELDDAGLIDDAISAYKDARDKRVAEIMELLEGDLWAPRLRVEGVTA